MKNKKIIIINALILSLILSNKNIYAETSEDAIVDRLNQNLEKIDNEEIDYENDEEIDYENDEEIDYENDEKMDYEDIDDEENIYKNIEYKIDSITINDFIIKGSVKNCNNIEIKTRKEIITQNIENNTDEWIDFSVEIDLKGEEKIDIIFSNEFGDVKIDTFEIKSIDLENKFKLLSELTSKTKEINLKCDEDIVSVYVVIDGVEYRGKCINQKDNIFNIVIPEIKKYKKVIIVAVDKNEEKITKEELVKEIKQENNKEEGKQNNQTINNKKYKDILDLKIMELNNKSSKISGVTLPNSKIYTEINGINYTTTSDKKGYFEIDLFIKKKEGTKVLFKIKSDNKIEKTFIKYVQDKVAPKKPYIANTIKENNNYIKGKAEPYANIIINIKTPTHIVKDDVISVRKKPKKGLNKIGRLLKGANILVLESNDEWSKIEFKESVGYVKTSEIEKIAYMKEFTYKGKSDSLGEYEVKIGRHEQGSRVRVQAEDENKNISKANIKNIEKE